MDRKALIACLLMATVAAFCFFTLTTDKYYTHIQNTFALLTSTRNLSAQAFNESHEPSSSSNISASRTPHVVSKTSHDAVPTRSNINIEYTGKLRKEGHEPKMLVRTPPEESTISHNSTRPVKPNLSDTEYVVKLRKEGLEPKKLVGNPTEVSTISGNWTRPVLSFIEYQEKLRKLGLEPTNLHEFKSIYIIDPIIYDDDTIYRVPGKRKHKIISCYNCPIWFSRNGDTVGYNRDFRNCPYSECYFDPNGVSQSKADLVLFFPAPRKRPHRPPGQMWAYCSWESPVHYGYPPNYSDWKDLFNWTMSFRQDADVFAPNNRFSWRARENLLSDAEYLRIAKSKTKTAAWFVSNCNTQSRRQEYVRRMKKIIDIDIFGRCTKIECARATCDTRLNGTYKFYLSFENSLCKDYVTEKLFRNFARKALVVPVVRGGLDYQKHLPPNTVVDASKFESPEKLAEYLKELGDDLPRYTAMLKEKDKLTTINYKYDWCELCERLHKGVKPKMMSDVKQVTHYSGVCQTPNL